ncbi:MAG: hypothetical protein JWM86_1423 [Thermoleophilia bacterium]|nr:hypothetical protein [Thermoleophilia bacterium]
MLSSVAVLLITAGVIASTLVAPGVAPAADALLETRTLYLTERFAPTVAPRPGLADTFPEQLMAMRGEREGFQLAINNTSGADLSLDAKVTPDGALGAQQASGQIDWELLRVGFVNVPTASTRVDAGAVPGAYAAGVYEDALPPFRPNATGGKLSIPAGTWGGIVLIAKVRTDAVPGTYTGTLEASDGNTTYARQGFSIEVRNGELRQPGAKNSFKTVMHVEGDAYWLQDSAMRNGLSAKYPSQPDRMLQLQGLYSFLDTRNISINELSFANPAASGAYTCASYTSHSSIAPFPFLEQAKQRYFGQAREIQPGAQQFPARMLPAETEGCNPEDVNGHYNAKIDKYRTQSVKQDDILHPGAASFFKNIASAWSANGFYNAATYVKNPFDEPSDVTANMRYQYTTQVPKANTLLHAAVGGKAKVVLADWPRDNANRKVCRIAAGHKSCTTLSGDGFSNKNMWDGRGTDDTDVWLAPFSRLFGRPSNPTLAKLYKVNRERMYADRLAGIKKLRGGREVWAYNFYTANASQPQLTIDAPATDARMNFWILAREGHTGLFISNSILGWGATDKTNTNGTKRKGNPWQGATYFQHPVYGAAAGWGNFMYPGYYAPLGMASESDRNTAAAKPVTTLRMEGLRDGNEDGNLMLQYRERFGPGGVNAATKPVFTGKYGQLPKQLGQVMFPKYANTADLAQRMERQRRAMIVALTS